MRYRARIPWYRAVIKLADNLLYSRFARDKGNIIAFGFLLLRMHADGGVHLPVLLSGAGRSNSFPSGYTSFLEVLS